MIKRVPSGAFLTMS